MQNDTTKLWPREAPARHRLRRDIESCFVVTQHAVTWSWPTGQPADCLLALTDRRKRRWSCFLEQVLGRPAAMRAFDEPRRFIAASCGPHGEVTFESFDAHEALALHGARTDQAARGRGRALELHVYLYGESSRAVLEQISLQRLAETPARGTA